MKYGREPKTVIVEFEEIYSEEEKRIEKIINTL